MRAAIYARYSSENQRPESITDQIASCRRLAAERGYEILDEHVYADEATSGSLSDRSGLTALRAAAEQGLFQVVLVDDLSRLARNALLMLSVLEELRFIGVRVVSVADGLDTEDEESTVGIQIRGIFNELQLTDLRKKTFRGQLGQKQRGFVVGEATYGYRSVPVGQIRMDKKGRPRPEGYRMTVEPSEAAIVLRIFRSFADGSSESAILRTLNEEGVPSRRSGRGHWAPASIHRILRSEKYIGSWAWNKTRSRRDPRTGRRRKFTKPEADWVVNVDESLRIVPQDLWEAVQARIATVRGTWPGGKGKRGFETQKGSRVSALPAGVALGLDGLRGLRFSRRQGQREGRGLLRVSVGCPGPLHEQAADSPDPGGEDRPVERPRTPGFHRGPPVPPRESRGRAPSLGVHRTGAGAAGSRPSSRESSAVSRTSSSSWPRGGEAGRWVTPSSRPNGASTR